MRLYVDSVSANTNKGQFSLICSHQSMPTNVSFDEVREKTFSDETVVGVGKNRSKVFTCDLKKTPHFLVAGETSSGKSTFIRNVTVAFYEKNKDMLFSIIDLKMGLESTMYEG